MSVEILQGDALERLRELDDCSVDSVVTDPPYGLSFMGKKWDYDVPSVEVWAECLRVLKPGGHLLAFAGTRTQHRMAVRIEDAGFEIRDMIAWVYGQGFPKSLDVSKAIDKGAGAEREILGTRRSAGGRAGGTYPKGPVSEQVWTISPDVPITAPATPEAAEWQGWGTALKPAMEPITVARKPLVGTVSQNVLAHGTGALNIDGCRVPGEYLCAGGPAGFKPERGWNQHSMKAPEPRINQGRWPANLIHDGSEEVLAGFPESTSGMRQAGNYALGGSERCYNMSDQPVPMPALQANSSSAARFFYCCKASKAERGDGNDHPTVKPLALMRYLCRLVTPPGGTVLDPFAGSGTTGVAAKLEGFEFILIELNEDYCELARRRIADANPSLFCEDVP